MNRDCKHEWDFRGKGGREAISRWAEKKKEQEKRETFMVQ